QVNSVETGYFVPAGSNTWAQPEAPRMSARTPTSAFVRDIPMIIDPDDQDYDSYPVQTYQEATGHKENTASGTGGNSAELLVSSGKPISPFNDHLSGSSTNSDELLVSSEPSRSLVNSSSLSTPNLNEFQKETLESCPIDFSCESLNDSAAWGLVSSELDILNLSGSLEQFSIVVSKSKSRPVEEILGAAHAEVLDIEASRKRRRVEVEDLLNPEISDNHQFGPGNIKSGKLPKKRTLKPIIGRKDEGPLDYKSMLSQTLITMSVLEF
ncbi:hypothetical protein K3495_g16572, partial [Podosphaera aphanis]